MDVGTEQQHASSWLRHEAPRVGSYEPTPGMLPSEDIGEMFTPHFLDQGSHMNAAAGYYNQAARAMGGYRSSHGKHLFYFYFLERLLQGEVFSYYDKLYYAS